MARGGSRRKEISKKSTLNYKEVYDELVNQNEIPIKMTATKEDLNILEANFDRKINKMSNILLEKLQNVIDKTFGSAEINLRSISDDGNQNKCSHEIGLLNDKVQSLEVENSFLKNEIHELTTLLNTITTSLSCKSKTAEMESTLHEKSDCQEVAKELNNVNYCTDNLTDFSAIDHQLPSLNNPIDFLIDTVLPTKATKNKNVIQELKNSCTKISPNNGNDNNKDYLCDSRFQSSVQINQSSTCIDIETILKELDVEYNNEQESNQSNDKHHLNKGFKSSTLICFDAAEKAEETKTVELHQGQFETPNAMTENVYDNESTPWPVNTVLIAGDSIINGIDEKRISKKNSIVKVRYFNGALVEDMFYNLVPLMRKKPSALILHVGTNNTVSDSSKVILKKINSLISYIKINNPECRIIISQPVRRTDNGKATLTLNNLNKLLAELDVDKIDNSNIDVSCLGKRGLHLNSIGTGKLALNFIKFLKAFCNADFARKSLGMVHKTLSTLV